VPQLRPRAARADAAAVLVQQPARRVPGLRGLRARDRRRPRQGDPRPARQPRGRRGGPVHHAGEPRAAGVDAARRDADRRAHRRAVARLDARRARLRARRRAERRARTAARRAPLPGRARLLPLARAQALQDARPHHAGALSRLHAVRAVRRTPAASRGARGARRRARHRRAHRAADRRRARVDRAPVARRRGTRAGVGAAERDPDPAALPGRGRARLLDARPPGADVVGRRGAAHPPRERARREAHRHALLPRRADGRPARARLAAPARRAQQLDAGGQHRGPGRARSGRDPGRGPRARPRSRRWRARRQRDVRRTTVGDAGRALGDRTPARGARRRRRAAARRARAAPRSRRRAASATASRSTARARTISRT
jgi:hypothetical protein